MNRFGEAARWVPMMIALVNGLAPLVICLLIMMPLWLGTCRCFTASRASAVCGPGGAGADLLPRCFLGRISGVSWWRSGLQTLLVALVTAALITLIASD